MSRGVQNYIFHETEWKMNVFKTQVCLCQFTRLERDESTSCEVIIDDFHYMSWDRDVGDLRRCDAS